MNDDAKFDSTYPHHPHAEVLGRWVSERTAEVMFTTITRPWSRESARAFADMIRDFESFAAENAPWLDTAFLPWLMFMSEHAGRTPTPDEVEEFMVEFERATVH